MAELILQACDLSIGHDRRAVVEGLNFSVEAGSTLALVGGNGSGKTTLLRTIAGLLMPVSGQITVMGTSPRLAARRMAWLGQFQTTNPLLPLRARELVRMAFYPQKGLLRRFSPQDEALIDEALAHFHADSFARQPISELSGGQRQRVYLAYVLARQASLILLDEPLSNLDAEAMDLYTLAVENFRRIGATVIVATHNLEDAATCDRSLVFGPQGWLFGTGQEVLKTLPHHH